MGDEARRRRGGWWWLLPVLLLLGLLAILAAALGWFDSGSKHHSTSVAPGVTAPGANPTSGSLATTPASAPVVTSPAPGPAASGPATSAPGAIGANPNVAAPAPIGLVGGGAVAPTQATGALAGPGAIGDVLFPEAGATLDADAQAVVARAVADIRSEHATRVAVTGYTDGIGDAAANQQLSIQRAEAVIAALKQQLGTSVTFAGAAYGQSRPVATNDTAAGRQLNRRVGIVAQ